MKVEKFNPYEDYEVKNRADKYIMCILNCADFFEYRMRMKPTVFMSNDVLAIILQYHSEKVTSQNRGEALTICGYELKMVFGKNVLYFGCKIAEPAERRE